MCNSPLSPPLSRRNRHSPLRNESTALGGSHVSQISDSSPRILLASLRARGAHVSSASPAVALLPPLRRRTSAAVPPASKRCFNHISGKSREGAQHSVEWTAVRMSSEHTKTAIAFAGAAQLQNVIFALFLCVSKRGFGIRIRQWQKFPDVERLSCAPQACLAPQSPLRPRAVL